MVKMRNVYVFIKETEGIKSVGTYKHRWEGNITTEP
jgi:hypothetical protein